MDTWISLRDIEADGERNRGLYVLKSRGHGPFQPDPRVRADSQRHASEGDLYRAGRGADRLGTCGTDGP